MERRQRGSGQGRHVQSSPCIGCCPHTSTLASPSPCAPHLQACTQSCSKRASWSSTSACRSQSCSQASRQSRRRRRQQRQRRSSSTRTPLICLRAHAQLCHPCTRAVGVEFNSRKLSNLLHGGDLWFKGALQCDYLSGSWEAGERRAPRLRMTSKLARSRAIFAPALCARRLLRLSGGRARSRCASRSRSRSRSCPCTGRHAGPVGASVEGAATWVAPLPASRRPTCSLAALRLAAVKASRPSACSGPPLPPSGDTESNLLEVVETGFRVR